MVHGTRAVVPRPYYMMIISTLSQQGYRECATQKLSQSESHLISQNRNTGPFTCEHIQQNKALKMSGVECLALWTIPVAVTYFTVNAAVYDIAKPTAERKTRELLNGDERMKLEIQSFQVDPSSKSIEVELKPFKRSAESSAFSLYGTCVRVIPSDVDDES